MPGVHRQTENRQVRSNYLLAPAVNSALHIRTYIIIQPTNSNSIIKIVTSHTSVYPLTVQVPTPTSGQLTTMNSHIRDILVYND